MWNGRLMRHQLEIVGITSNMWNNNQKVNASAQSKAMCWVTQGAPSKAMCWVTPSAQSKTMCSVPVAKCSI